MRLRSVIPIAICAVMAVAAWPAYIASRSVSSDAANLGAAAAATPAPVLRDYQDRDSLVAFWEGAVRERHTNDMLSPRQLAGQYLARYRERGDIDDVIRAQHMAERSLAIDPHSIGATSELATVMLTLHRFRDALHDVDTLVPYDPHGAQFLAQRASLEMELGRYASANVAIQAIRPAEAQTPAALTVRSRYQELTGHLGDARTLLAAAMQQVDTFIDEPAQARAWYHVRAGELAFEAGDNDRALADERAALAIFPTYNIALKDLAKFELANHHYAAALDAATRGAQVTPFAETLGYEADAQAALGSTRDAAATRDVIFAVERLGNAYHVNDRLLAIYYTDHHLRPDDALAIARREALTRGDEIYAQDTLAWAAAMDGHWAEAQRAAASATRLGTQDPIVQYHAAIIALHYGQRAAAKDGLNRALHGNPHFHPTFADNARRLIVAL